MTSSTITANPEKGRMVDFCCLKDMGGREAVPRIFNDHYKAAAHAPWLAKHLLYLSVSVYYTSPALALLLMTIDGADAVMPYLQGYYLGMHGRRRVSAHQRHGGQCCNLLI